MNVRTVRNARYFHLSTLILGVEREKDRRIKNIGFRAIPLKGHPRIVMCQFLVRKNPEAEWFIQQSKTNIH